MAEQSSVQGHLCAIGQLALKKQTLAVWVWRGAAHRKRGSQRLLLQGKLPDGTRVTLHAAVFSHGTQVFQASVLGGQVSAEAADMFFDALRVQP